MTDTPPKDTSLPIEEPSTEGTPMKNNGNNTRASWNFSLDQIRSNLSHCDPDAKQVMIEAFLWCIDPKHPITRPEFCSAVDAEPNTVWRVYSGKYLSSVNRVRLDVPKKLVEATREFLRNEKLRFERAKNEFVTTPTAQSIWTICDLARKSQTPAFIIGPSHIGKTWALERYSALNNHGRSPYIRIPAALGLGGMIKAMCAPLGISENGNTKDLIQRIKNAITDVMVLLLDEMHMLTYTYRRESFFACLEVLREIYDSTNCGMVLCGTELFMSHVNDARKGEMQQFLRRGIHRLQLGNMATREDIEMILAHNGMSMPDKNDVVNFDVDGEKFSDKPRTVLVQLAKLDGLKSITERIRLTREIAGREGVKIDWRLFLEIHTRIVSSNVPPKNWE